MRLSADDYVAGLVEHLKKVRAYVDEQHSKIRDDSLRAKYRELGPGGHLNLGDYCLVKKQPIQGVSSRFQRPTFDKCFQVVEVHGTEETAKAYTLSDLQGNRDGLGFTQPVSLDRLIPVELLPLIRPAEDGPVRINLQEAGRDRPARITNQCLDGRVYIEYEDAPGVERCIDLSTCRYQWL